MEHTSCTTLRSAWMTFAKLCIHPIHFCINYYRLPTEVFPGGSVVKNLPAKQEIQFWHLSQEDTPEKEMAPTPIFLPGKFHEQRRLVGYSPWGRKGLDMIEQLNTHTHKVYSFNDQTSLRGKTTSYHQMLSLCFPSPLSLSQIPSRFLQYRTFNLPDYMLILPWVETAAY